MNDTATQPEKKGFWTKDRRSASDVIWILLAFFFVVIPLILFMPTILSEIFR